MTLLAGCRCRCGGGCRGVQDGPQGYAVVLGHLALVAFGAAMLTVRAAHALHIRTHKDNRYRMRQRTFTSLPKKKYKPTKHTR